MGEKKKEEGGDNAGRVETEETEEGKGEKSPAAVQCRIWEMAARKGGERREGKEGRRDLGERRGCLRSRAPFNYKGCCRSMVHGWRVWTS